MNKAMFNFAVKCFFKRESYVCQRLTKKEGLSKKKTKKEDNG